jgi:hypothetical protein
VEHNQTRLILRGQLRPRPGVNDIMHLRRPQCLSLPSRVRKRKIDSIPLFTIALYDGSERDFFENFDEFFQSAGFSGE